MTALHIGRLCRAVSYELLTYWSPGGTVFPSVKTLADDMGLKRRAVRHHIAHLERVGLWVRIGREDETNLYVLHLPGEAQEGFVEPSPRHAHAAPPARTCRPPGTHMPPEVIKEVIKEVISTSAARASCPNCKRTWPAKDGTVCYQCDDLPQRLSSTAIPEPDTEQTTNPDEYRGSRIRNCPQCHAYERGYDDTCQSCDWTREAWEARESS